jgi:hypothetical protein
MTWLEALLVIIIIGLIAFLIYYYMKGSSGSVAITKPMESRVDEYLDRRFELMIDEWSLINRPKLQSFLEHEDQTLAKDEARVAALKDFRGQMSENLGKLEDRLNALEKQIGPK